MQWVVLIALLASCGRYGFDHQSEQADSGDASPGDAGDDDGGDPDDGGPGDGRPGDSGAAGDGPAITCPSLYSFAIGSSRYRGGNQASWTTAEANCESDGPGIHLVVIDTMTEMNALAPLTNNSRTWVGVSDRKTDNVFLRVTGGVAPYLPWRSGDPSQSGSACAAWDPQPREYRDEPCSQGRQYICECDGLPADPNAY